MSESIKQFLEDMRDVERYRAMEARLNKITGSLMMLEEIEWLGFGEDDKLNIYNTYTGIQIKNDMVRDRWMSIFTNYSQILSSEREVRVGGYVVEYASDHNVVVVLGEDDRIVCHVCMMEIDAFLWVYDKLAYHRMEDADEGE